MTVQKWLPVGIAFALLLMASAVTQAGQFGVCLQIIPNKAEYSVGEPAYFAAFLSNDGNSTVELSSNLLVFFRAGEDGTPLKRTAERIYGGAPQADPPEPSRFSLRPHERRELTAGMIHRLDASTVWNEKPGKYNIQAYILIRTTQLGRSGQPILKDEELLSNKVAVTVPQMGKEDKAEWQQIAADGLKCLLAPINYDYLATLERSDLTAKVSKARQFIEINETSFYACRIRLGLAEAYYMVDAIKNQSEGERLFQTTDPKPPDYRFLYVCALDGAIAIEPNPSTRSKLADKLRQVKRTYSNETKRPASAFYMDFPY